ncbi:MAG TPA: hypothetical protein VIM58_09340, partial [Candidatus Methylacidiphilales bacterium]
MRLSSLSAVLVLLVLSLVSSSRSLAGDLDPRAVDLLGKVKAAYSGASSFSADGEYTVELRTERPLKSKGTFKILYSRPDLFRFDWSETEMGGEVFTNSIFTRDKGLFFYWASMGKVAPQKSIEDAIGGAAGISHGTAYAIPSLLLGKTGYLG